MNKSVDFTLTAYLKDLEYLVNIDSGSRDVAGIEKIAGFFVEKFSDIGWQVTTHNFDEKAGPCLEIVNSNAKKYDVLFMGHMDTVFPKGTAQERPFSVREGKAFGPGVIDCKAGLLYVYYALAILQQEGKLTNTSICVAFNSDEEISSVYSRLWLEQLSLQSKCVFVLEAARANGNLVNKRKGVGRYKLEFNGVAAHSGVDHEKGRSAIEELAHWILALHAKTNYATGTTVNVGIINGGTAVNAVADQARAEVDIRIFDLAEAQEIDNLLKGLAAQPYIEGVSAKISGGVTRPPMIPSPKTLALCRLIDRIGSNLEIEFGWSTTGGGSDGSFAAIQGIPTIDGLGPVGGGAHGPNEYLVIESVEPRFRLLCAIIQELAESAGESVIGF